ncbi:TraR/DksA C4-type zinc finger protein [Pseudomonas aeruginosa]|uniref:TraR/DksA C4-type zinc finger protein n=1 Tax=Pseudomonas aeruginosa TaxID=287 RepID=UPI0039BCEA20
MSTSRTATRSGRTCANAGPQHRCRHRETDCGCDRPGQRTGREHDPGALAQRTNTRPAPSALWCEDCGEQIPEARRQAAPGCKCCISCQELREHPARR